MWWLRSGWYIEAHHEEVQGRDEAPAGLSLSSQRVRLMLITSTQGSVSRSCWVVFFWLSLPDRNLETSVRIHSVPFHSIPFHSIPFHSIPSARSWITRTNKIRVDHRSHRDEEAWEPHLPGCTRPVQLSGTRRTSRNLRRTTLQISTRKCLQTLRTQSLARKHKPRILDGTNGDDWEL